MKAEKTIRFIDLFCGIGGFRYAIEGVAEKFGIGKKSSQDSSARNGNHQMLVLTTFLQQTAWGAKTVKNKKPSTVSKIRLISGRNSVSFSFGQEKVKNVDVDDMGEKVLSIYNERGAGSLLTCPPYKCRGFSSSTERVQPV